MERAAARIRFKDDVLQARERLLSSPSIVPDWVQNTGLEHASPPEAILPFSTDEFQLITLATSRSALSWRSPVVCCNASITRQYST
jgi:hypothetical protein